MKTTNIQILEYLSVLQKFEDKIFPQKISYAILKNLQLFSKEQEVYTKALQKILNAYEDKTIKNEDGSQKMDLSGLPVVDDEYKNDYYQEITDLLLMEVNITPYYVPEEIFDYDNPNGRYDTISPKEMFMLVSILCKSTEEANETE